MALLNMLIAPLNSFPWVLNGLTEAWVSLKRVQRLIEVLFLKHLFYCLLPTFVLIIKLFCFSSLMVTLLI